MTVILYFIYPLRKGTTLYEFVTLSWNEQTLQGKVVKRWLDLDESLWLYQLAGVGSDRLFPEAALAVSVQSQSRNG